MSDYPPAVPPAAVPPAAAPVMSSAKPGAKPGATPTTAAAAPTDRVRLRRKPDRGHYDRATIDAILDAAIVAHVGFVVDGQPFVIPTVHWRQGDHVYWHGSAASRMMRVIESGAPVCLTVSLIDSVVLARSAHNHSTDYRSVVVIGVAKPVLGDSKTRALDALVDAIAPGRAATLRPTTAKEEAAITVVSLSLDEASAKVRDAGVGDDPGDETWPVWAGTVPVRLVFGEPIPAPDLAPGTEVPNGVRSLTRR